MVNRFGGLWSLLLEIYMCLILFFPLYFCLSVLVNSLAPALPISNLHSHGSAFRLGLDHLELYH